MSSSSSSSTLNMAARAPTHTRQYVFELRVMRGTWLHGKGRRTHTCNGAARVGRVRCVDPGAIWRCRAATGGPATGVISCSRAHTASRAELEGRGGQGGKWQQHLGTQSAGRPAGQDAACFRPHLCRRAPCRRNLPTNNTKSKSTNHPHVPFAVARESTNGGSHGG